MLHVRQRRHLAKVQADRLARVAWRRLRAREEVDRLVVPVGLEGARRVLHDAHAEEAIARLYGRDRGAAEESGGLFCEKVTLKESLITVLARDEIRVWGALI